MADGLQINPTSPPSSQGAAPTNPAKPVKPVFDKEEFSIRKRLPPHLPKRNNDVYVTNKTAFKAQLDR